MLQEGRVNGIQKPNLDSKDQQMVEEWMRLDKVICQIVRLCVTPTWNNVVRKLQAFNTKSEADRFLVNKWGGLK